MAHDTCVMSFLVVHSSIKHKTTWDGIYKQDVLISSRKLDVGVFTFRYVVTKKLKIYYLNQFGCIKNIKVNQFKK